MNDNHGAVSVPPFDEVFTGEGWSYVNREHVRAAFKFFDADPNVHTGFNFRMDALLNGGIIFRRKHKEMKGKAKDWMSHHFTQFLKEVVRNRWCVGFAACAWQGHGEFGGRPIVLDLTQITIRYKLDIFGDPSYRFFHQPQNSYCGELEIKDVLVFSWQPPDAQGNLRSIIPLLSQDHLYENMLNYYSVLAMKGRAMPVMITEKEREVYDPENIRAPMARTADEIRMGVTMGESAFSTDRADNAILNQTEEFYSGNQPAMAGVLTGNVAALQHMPYFAAHYRLEQGRKFTSAPLPEGPPNLLEFRIARQERAFALMGVPLAMVTNSTSTGNARMGNTENQNSFVIFDNSQQSLKLELINLCKTMFYNIHLQAHLEEYLKHTPAAEWNAEDAMSSAEVTVEMPSMPDEAKLISYYTSGWLKYSSLVSYLSSKHGISLDSFETKPALTVKEANGEFADPPEAKKAKKK